MQSYVKRPTETFSIAIEFAAKLPAGATLSGGVLTATDRTTGADVTGTVLQSATATINGTQASFRGQAGASPTDYLIRLTATLSDGSVLVEDVLMQVRDSFALVATAGAANANSYCTRQEADDYHKTHLYNSVWLDADDWKREAALIWATRLLDQEVQWNGYPNTLSQALQWPRANVWDRNRLTVFDSTTIPTFLKQATAEFARWLLASDRTVEPTSSVQSIKADTVEVVYSDPIGTGPIVPPAVAAMVQPFGMVTGSGMGYAKLERV